MADVQCPYQGWNSTLRRLSVNPHGAKKIPFARAGGAASGVEKHKADLDL